MRAVRGFLRLYERVSVEEHSEEVLLEEEEREVEAGFREGGGLGLFVVLSECSSSVVTRRQYILGHIYPFV